MDNFSKINKRVVLNKHVGWKVQISVVQNKYGQKICLNLVPGFTQFEAVFTHKLFSNTMIFILKNVYSIYRILGKIYFPNVGWNFFLKIN